MFRLRRFDRRAAAQRWIQKLALGEPQVLVQLGGYELAVHRQEGRPAEHLVDLASVPVGTLWLMERTECGGAAGPLVSDWIQAPVHRCPQRRGMRLSDQRVICGLLPPAVARVEAVLGDHNVELLSTGADVFLLVAAQVGDVRVIMYDHEDDLIREHEIPGWPIPGLPTRLYRRLEPGMFDYPPDLRSQWYFSWST